MQTWSIRSGIREFLTGEEDRRRVRGFEQSRCLGVKPQPESHREDPGTCQLKTGRTDEKESSTQAPSTRLHSHGLITRAEHYMTLRRYSIYSSSYTFIIYSGL